MKNTSVRTKGELCILLSALLWSLFPVITILSYSVLSPLITAALSTLLSAAFFALCLTAWGRWHELKRTSAWKNIALTTLFIGVLFYGFIFMGLRHTSAGNESILALMEVFFSFLFLSLLFRHESVTKERVFGASFMVIGASFILLPRTTGMHAGDVLIIIATMFAPLGNLHAKRARAIVSSETIMFVRSLLSGLFLLVLALCLEPLPSPEAFRLSLLPLLFNGIFLLGISKILWIEGINLIPITHAISIESISPAFTFVFAALILREHVTVFEILGLVPIVIGILLLTKRSVGSS